MLPPGLVREVKAYDPKLRVRVAETCGEVWIEQPMPSADPEVCAALESDYRLQLDLLLENAPERHPIARRIEAVKAAKDGYRAVMFIPRELAGHTERIMRALYESDITKQGGREGINRAFDAATNAFYVERDKERRRYAEDGARDVYDRIAWLDGRRVTTSDMAAGAETSDRVESHEGFVVRVRKGVHA